MKEAGDSDYECPENDDVFPKTSSAMEIEGEGIYQADTQIMVNEEVVQTSLLPHGSKTDV